MTDSTKLEADVHYWMYTPIPGYDRAIRETLSRGKTVAIHDHKETEECDLSTTGCVLVKPEGDADEPGRREAEGPDNSADGASETDAD